MESATQFYMLIGVVIAVAVACFKPVRYFINTGDSVEINGEWFLTGEHKHVPDDFGLTYVALKGSVELETVDIMLSYPQIKEVLDGEVVR